MNWQSKNVNLDIFQTTSARVLINGFLEIYSQKPTILVADVILDTTMKMMIPIYLKKADTETNMKIFFVFHEKYIISAPKPQKNGGFRG